MQQQTEQALGRATDAQPQQQQRQFEQERQQQLNRFGRWVVKPFRRLWKALLTAPPGE